MTDIERVARFLEDIPYKDMREISDFIATKANEKINGLGHDPVDLTPDDVAKILLAWSADKKGGDE